MEQSKIEWTHHTFNPWQGCTKVSPACDHCYAESLTKRFGHKVWGHAAPRKFHSDDYWAKPLKWNEKALLAGVREKVFCASMADVFEARADLDEQRERLWQLIEQTPQLDWLLLTKRPHLVNRMVPWHEQLPDNVWIGTTVENQEFAHKRLDELLDIPARVRFVSAEPLLGQLNLIPWLAGLQWIIAGGESGHHSRPTPFDWFAELRDQCWMTDTPFFFKQWGDWVPVHLSPIIGTGKRQIVKAYGETFIRLGKKYTGHTLGSRVWQEFPDRREHIRKL